MGTFIEITLSDGGTRQLSAPLIAVDTGTLLAIPGAGEVPVLDSTLIIELDELPEHLIILGGGYIAVEFGQMFRRFGSEVTIVQREAQLLSAIGRVPNTEALAPEAAGIRLDDRGFITAATAHAHPAVTEQPTAVTAGGITSGVDHGINYQILYPNGSPE